MMEDFKKITFNEAKTVLGDKATPDSEYFKFFYKNQEVGIIGIWDLANYKDNKKLEVCNLHYYIYPEYRPYQTLAFGKKVINFPKELGFRIVFMMTFREKLQRILARLEGFGVRFAGKFLNYYCFFKNFDEGK